ncbi:MAG: CYTH domain-containing protein [Candidatus Eremiobacterota bacterium]
MGLERELKFALDRAGYERMAECLGTPFEEVEQVNVYLDTASSQIEAMRAALRLRREGGQLLLTYKRGRAQTGAYFEIAEFEVPITPDQWLGLETGSSLPDLEPLQELHRDVPSLDPLVCLGRVENLRRRYPLPTGDVAELDRTVFPNGRVDYELEVETADPEAVERWLREHAGFPLVAQQTTKYRRFLDAIRPAG